MLTAACGNKQAPPPDVPGAPPPKPALTKPAGNSAPVDRIPRPLLEAVLREGPAWVFDKVPLEEVLEQGKFVGWRVRELPAEWGKIELQPGDVVTQVNTMPLETPADFWTAWTTLTVASELKVAYLRDGEAKEMSYPIDVSPDPALSHRLKKRPAQAGANAPDASDAQPVVPGNEDYNPPKRKKTVVIKGRERPLSDTLVDWSH
jgi:hypothetical protein